MGLRAEKNILLYDKNKLIVITDLFCYYDFNKLDSLQCITILTNLIKKIKTLHDIENLLQCILGVVATSCHPCVYYK